MTIASFCSTRCSPLVVTDHTATNAKEVLAMGEIRIPLGTPLSIPLLHGNMVMTEFVFQTPIRAGSLTALMNVEQPNTGIFRFVELIGNLPKGLAEQFTLDDFVTIQEAITPWFASVVRYAEMTGQMRDKL